MKASNIIEKFGRVLLLFLINNCIPTWEGLAHLLLPHREMLLYLYLCFGNSAEKWLQRAMRQLLLFPESCDSSKLKTILETCPRKQSCGIVNSAAAGAAPSFPMQREAPLAVIAMKGVLM